ncbi:hypothetical protein OG413_14350 [Streptomyces sp. NBC_01433]|nr:MULTISPECIES: hypothetical protein [unclassified Streptomyces]MCX4676468.1 hypothetical protein [Streptomyces sp. NBC_01433]
MSTWEFASVAVIANLTHRLELALEQIEELYERVERLKRGDRPECDGG